MVAELSELQAGDLRGIAHAGPSEKALSCIGGSLTSGC